MFDKISPGNNVPHEINVIIEIAANQNPIKYEVDKISGAIFVDRFMSTCMHYPCNYGYIPKTLAQDGDPADVLVVTPFPVIPGSVIRSRPIGCLKMSDEAGVDFKILAVPVTKLCTIYDKVGSYLDMPTLLIKQIEHFFTHYKDLEPNKWAKVEGWQDKKVAMQEIMGAIERYV
ncbi:MAG: inorganic diphosphatase [Gammaproteobacteria bacterium]|nr:inorganic diphosphatase [Gammaproteobacteria bacterium]